MVLSLLLAAANPGARGQESPDDARKAGDTQALSARYKFEEKYALADDPANPRSLSQYMVASRETTKITQETPQGAPRVDQSVLQAIYTDRVAEVGKEGLVSAIARRYEKARLTSTIQFTSYKTKWLEGLSILYRLQPNRLTPLVLSLDDRQLRQQEYEHITLQTFLPILSTFLPKRPARIGDTWLVGRPALWSLVGEMPGEDGFEVSAELREVRKDDSGQTMTAVIDVKGDFELSEGPSAVNAQIYFGFEPTEAVAARRGIFQDQAKEETGGLFDAKGHITKIRMAQVITMTMPGSDGRLKQTIERSLVLDRRTTAEAGASFRPVELPNPAPAPTVANSWLLYDDPQGRFHLLFPQEFRVAKVYPDGGIDLLDPRPDGQDVIQVNLVSKGQDPRRDRLAVDPLQEKKSLEEDWRKRGEKVLPGPADWLPDADWADTKRKVYRIEAALVPEPEGGQAPTPSSGRIYMDRYIVQFTRNEVIRVTAMTTRDLHVPFRDQAEALIKTFEFGPSKGSTPAVKPAPPGAEPSPGG